MCHSGGGMSHSGIPLLPDVFTEAVSKLVLNPNKNFPLHTPISNASNVTVMSSKKLHCFLCTHLFLFDCLDRIEYFE